MSEFLKLKSGGTLIVDTARRFDSDFRVRVSTPEAAITLTPDECDEFIGLLKTTVEDARRCNVQDERNLERIKLNERIQLTRAEFGAHLKESGTSIEQEESRRAATLVECPPQNCNVHHCQGWRFEPDIVHHV